MREDPTLRGHPDIAPINSRSMPHGSKAESSTVSQDRLASAPRPSGELERREKDVAARAEEVGRLRRDVEGLRGMVDKQGAEIIRLRRERDEQTARCKRRDERAESLKHDIAKMRGSHKEAMEAQIRQTRAVQEQLKQAEELSEARSAELSGAQTFLSTADRLSEMEVLSIVRDLNESIYQVAVGLTERWETLDSSQAASRMDVDSTSRSYIPALVQLTRNQDLMGLTFLLQSNLCSLAAEMTSSWGRHRELVILESIYRRLSASGEHYAIEAE